MNIQRRNTAQRKLVLEAVLARHDHPCANDIYLDVVAREPRVSRGTVYRNLNLLSDSGEILHVKVPDGADRFDSRSENHFHVLCLRCHRVADVELPYSPELDCAAGKTSGFDIVAHRTVFEGYCPECRKELDKT